MKRGIFALAGLLAFLLAAPALAQDDENGEEEGLFTLTDRTYIGIGVQLAELTLEGVTATLTNANAQQTTFTDEISTEPTVLNLRAGWYLLPWLPIEAQVATGIEEDSISGGQFRGGEGDLDILYGLSVKPEYLFKLGEEGESGAIAVFASAGWSDFEYEIDGGPNISFAQGGDSLTVDDSGFSWGAGVQLVSESARLTLEYTNYFDDDDIQVEGVLLGVHIKL